MGKKKWKDNETEENVLEPQDDPTPARVEDPAPSLEVKADEIPEPKPVAEPPKSVISLRVFAAISGIRWDQFAGFMAYAQQAKMGPRTTEEWRAELVKFRSLPV